MLNVKAKTLAGTVVKLNVSLACAGLTMDEFDFSLLFYTSSYSKKVVRLEKSDLIREDANNYIAMVDTTGMSSGTLVTKAFAQIPDADCEGGFRPESGTFETEEYIQGV